MRTALHLALVGCSVWLGALLTMLGVAYADWRRHPGKR